MRKAILFLLALAWAAPLHATPKKPAAVPSAKLLKLLQLKAYEKGTDAVSDVSGLFDSKAQKITLKCELKNLTAKEIHGVRGILRFTTMFSELITDQSLETTAVIPSGKAISVTWTVPAERLTPKALETFKKLKLEEMRQIWYPGMIVFTDGSILK